MSDARPSSFSFGRSSHLRTYARVLLAASALGVVSGCIQNDILGVTQRGGDVARQGKERVAEFASVTTATVGDGLQRAKIRLADSVEALKAGGLLPAVSRRDPLGRGVAKPLQHGAPDRLRASLKSGVVGSPSRTTGSNGYDAAVRGERGLPDPLTSARCRELFAIAGADSVLLQSPTVSASLDDQRSAGLSIGYDLMDLQRAKLTQAEADARCRRYLAASKVSSYIITNNEALSHAGFQARADSLARDEDELRAVESSIARRLEQGFITAPSAAGLRHQMGLIRATRSQTRAAAARRSAVVNARNAAAGAADGELRRSVSDLAEIDRRRRSMDAWEIRLSAGYNSVEGEGTMRKRTGDTFGRVKVSVRTGALFDRRSRYEAEAHRARLDGLDEVNRGQLWRLKALREASIRTIGDLEAQRATLRAGLAKAHAAVQLTDGYTDERLLLARLRARLDMVRMRADLAAVDATIEDTRRTVDQLSR